MICLDQRGRVQCPALLHKGTVDQVQFYPREVVETALRHHAHAVLLVHNHPSGSPEPSQDDYDVTRMLIEALNVIGVRVVDHLVVSPGGLYSMMHHSQLLEGSPQPVSYLLRSRAVPGKPGTLRDSQDNAFVSLEL